MTARNTEKRNWSFKLYESRSKNYKKFKNSHVLSLMNVNVLSNKIQSVLH